MKGHSSSSYRWDLWDNRPVKAFSVHFYGKFVQTDNRWASLFIKRSQGQFGPLIFKSAPYYLWFILDELPLQICLLE